MRHLNVLLYVSIFFIVLISCTSNVSTFDNTNLHIPNNDRINMGYQLVETSIINGEVDVPVGIPFMAEFTSNVDKEVVIDEYFYIKSSKGDIIPSRLELNGNIVIIIPQRIMQPSETYTANLFEYSITYTNKDLDFGLYWFGKDGKCEKYFPEFKNSCYNKNSPTMIYTHGWQIGSVEKTDFYGRRNFSFELFHWNEDNFGQSSRYNGLELWTTNSWIDKGWNTGISYWTQFSDEESVSDAEKKIWFFDDENCTYRTVERDGNVVSKKWDRNYVFNNTTYFVNSVSELLAIQIQYCLSDNTSENIRLVGHSLGNQVVTNISKILTDNSIIVDRLVLLDPAWTLYSKDYLPNDSYGNWTGERSRNYIFESLDSGTLISVEEYHTSLVDLKILGMDSNEELSNKVCDVSLSPWYYKSLQFTEKHVCAIHNYFWSMLFEPPIEVDASWWARAKTGNFAPSASSLTSDIVSMMGCGYRWVQVEGRYTPTPEDNWYEKRIIK